MRASFPGYIHLWRLSWQEPHDLTHWRHLQARPYHQHEIDLVTIMQRQPLAEGVWKIFAEERDIGLHHPGNSDLVVFILVRAVFIVLALFLMRFWWQTPVAAFALDAPSSRLCLSQGLDTTITARDTAGFEIGVDCRTRDLVGAFETRGGGKGAVALDELRGQDAGMSLDIVDILGIVCEELGSVLQEADEGVSRREGRSRRKDVFGNGVEDGGVFAEDANVENFLRVREAEVLELGVEASGFGAEVGDAEGGRDLRGDWLVGTRGQEEGLRLHRLRR